MTNEQIPAVIQAIRQLTYAVLSVRTQLDLNSRNPKDMELPKLHAKAEELATLAGTEQFQANF